jgi:hypothetical protein
MKLAVIVTESPWLPMSPSLASKPLGIVASTHALARLNWTPCNWTVAGYDIRSVTSCVPALSGSLITNVSVKLLPGPTCAADKVEVMLIDAWRSRFAAAAVPAPAAANASVPRRVADASRAAMVGKSMMVFLSLTDERLF